MTKLFSSDGTKDIGPQHRVGFGPGTAGPQKTARVSALDTKAPIADKALVSVGRKPYTDGLNAEAAGVKITNRGAFGPGPNRLRKTKGSPSPSPSHRSHATACARRR